MNAAGRHGVAREFQVLPALEHAVDRRAAVAQHRSMQWLRLAFCFALIDATGCHDDASMPDASYECLGDEQCPAGMVCLDDFRCHLNPADLSRPRDLQSPPDREPPMDLSAPADIAPDLRGTQPCPNGGFEQQCARPRGPGCAQACPCLPSVCFDYADPRACPLDYTCYLCGMGCGDMAIP